MCLYYRTARPPNDLLNWSRHHFGNCLASLGKCNDLSSDFCGAESAPPLYETFYTDILLCSQHCKKVLPRYCHTWVAIRLYLINSRKSIGKLNKMSEAMLQLSPLYPSASCNSAVKDKPNQNIPNISYHIISIVAIRLYVLKMIEQIIGRNVTANVPPLPFCLI